MQVSFDHEKLFEGSGGFFCVSYTHEWAPVFGQNAFVHEEAVAEGERDRRDILCYKYCMFWTRYGACRETRCTNYRLYLSPAAVRMARCHEKRV